MTAIAIACILLAVAITAWAGPRCVREARERREAEDRSYDGLRTPGMGRLSLVIKGDTTGFSEAMNRVSASAASIYSALAPCPLNVGDKVKTASAKQRWTVRGVTAEGRFAILTKPFNVRHTVLYTVIDFERGVRGKDNYYGLGYETPEDIAEALACFQLTEYGDRPLTDAELDAGLHAAEVSHRQNNYVRLDLQEINGEPCEWDGSRTDDARLARERRGVR